MLQTKRPCLHCAQCNSTVLEPNELICCATVPDKLNSLGFFVGVKNSNSSGRYALVVEQQSAPTPCTYMACTKCLAASMRQRKSASCPTCGRIWGEQVLDVVDETARPEESATSPYHTLSGVLFKSSAIEFELPVPLCCEQPVEWRSLDNGVCRTCRKSYCLDCFSIIDDEGANSSARVPCCKPAKALRLSGIRNCPCCCALVYKYMPERCKFTFCPLCEYSFVWGTGCAPACFSSADYVNAQFKRLEPKMPESLIWVVGLPGELKNLLHTSQSSCDFAAVEVLIMIAGCTITPVVENMVREARVLETELAAFDNMDESSFVLDMGKLSRFKWLNGANHLRIVFALSRFKSLALRARPDNKYNKLLFNFPFWPRVQVADADNNVVFKPSVCLSRGDLSLDFARLGRDLFNNVFFKKNKK